MPHSFTCDLDKDKVFCGLHFAPMNFCACENYDCNDIIFGMIQLQTIKQTEYSL